MLKKISSLVTNIFSEPEAEQEDEDEEEEAGADFEENQVITGKITSLNRLSLYGILDDFIYFELKECHLKLQVGDMVTGRLYRNGTQWAIELDVSALTSEIQKEEENVDEHFESGPITSLIKSVATFKNTYTFDLKELKSDTYYFQGDMLRATIKDNKVIKIIPLRPMSGTGVVSRLTPYGGLINNEILYRTRRNGYVPKLNDPVKYEAIESNQGKMCWRATKIGPLDDSSNLRNKKFHTPFLGQNLALLLAPKQDIYITETLHFGKMDLNEIKSIPFKILNKGTKDQKLEKMYSVTDKWKELITLVPDEFPVTIPASQVVQLSLECRAIYNYNLNELVHFDFGSFKISRYFNGNIGANHWFSQEERNKFINVSTKCRVIPGQHLLENVKQINVLSNYQRIAQYHVPDSLWELTLDKKNMMEEFPVLSEDVNMENYQKKFTLLLQLEEIQDTINMKQYDMKQMGLERNGEFLSLIVPGLSENRPSLLLNDKVILIEPGYDDLREAEIYSGFIHGVHRNKILMKFNRALHAKYMGESFDVTFEINRSNYRRCHFALTLIPELESVLFPVPKDCQIKCSTLKIESWYNPNLNERQKSAVLRILQHNASSRPYILFGPPGTGKTMTLIETILQTYYKIPHSRILVCAPTNSAGDFIVNALASFEDIDPSIMVRLNSYQRNEEEVDQLIRPFTATGDDLKDVLVHRIIVTTTTFAGIFYKTQIGNFHISHLFIDEAGQCTEPETLISISLAPNARIVLAGDHMQLGPVNSSFIANDSGFSISLLERLMRRSIYQPNPKMFANHGNYDPFLVTKLIQNYRSVPDLITLPSKLFYHNELVSGYESVHPELAKHDMFPGKGFPLLFDGTVGEDCQDSDSPSWYNNKQVGKVFTYLKQLYEFGFKPDDVGIITPYRKQVQKLRSFISAFEIELCKIGSVEEFQGQERKIIIVTTVRTNSHKDKQKGFIFHPKRFNVSITRSKEALIVIGDPFLLAQVGCWKELIRFAHNNGAYKGPDLGKILDEE